MSGCLRKFTPCSRHLFDAAVVSGEPRENVALRYHRVGRSSLWNRRIDGISYPGKCGFRLSCARPRCVVVGTPVEGHRTLGRRTGLRRMLQDFSFSAPIIEWLRAHSPQGIVVTDTELVIRGWNCWLEEHTGRKGQDVLGKNLFEV